MRCLGFSGFLQQFQCSKGSGYDEQAGDKPCGKVQDNVKGYKEKVQLCLVMSREADVYLLDEPIAGVDPAARDYILNTIISNYNERAAVVISTHLIADIEPVLDDVVMIQNGMLRLHKSVDAIHNETGKSVDQLFREVYRC